MIQLNRICKSYQDGTSVHEVLKDISLTLSEGETVAITGRSGCGKTTLLNILGCLDTFDSGEYIFNKTNVKNIRRSKLSGFRGRNIGFVFQSYCLIEELTALENVMLPMEYAGVALKERKKRAYQLLERIGLAYDMNKLPSQLSGGEQQRTAIARAIALRPPLILADEPTGSLDKTNSLQVIDLLKELPRENGTTVVLVTHDSEIACKCDRFLRIDSKQ